MPPYFYNNNKNIRRIQYYLLQIAISYEIKKPYFYKL